MELPGSPNAPQDSTPDDNNKATLYHGDGQYPVPRCNLLIPPALSFAKLEVNTRGPFLPTANSQHSALNPVVFTSWWSCLKYEERELTRPLTLYHKSWKKITFYFLKSYFYFMWVQIPTEARRRVLDPWELQSQAVSELPALHGCWESNPVRSSCKSNHCSWPMTHLSKSFFIFSWKKKKKKTL